MDNKNKISRDYEIFIVNNILNFYDKHSLQFQPKPTCSEYITQYFNFRLRYIGVDTPRKVFISTELENKIKSHSNKHTIQNIISKLNNGEDVNPYQSIQLSNADYDDDLFNDWGLHHLHLSDKPHPTKLNFNERTNDLLFARFIDDKAYLIDILPHNNFSKKNLIAIIQNNWDYLLQESGHLWNPDFSEDEIKVMRKKGYTIGVNINGKGYFFIGHGYFSSGINMQCGIMSDNVLRWITQNIHLETQNSQLFKETILNLLQI